MGQRGEHALRSPGSLFHAGSLTPSLMRLAVWSAAPARALAVALGDLVTDVVEVEPHQMRAALDEGGVDLALVPTLDVFRRPDGIEAVPGVALAGERSPRLQLVVGSALDAIETVAFDPRDAQEALLTQLVLREHYGASAQFALADPGADVTDLLVESSAALVDVGEVVPEGAFALDPGQEWTDLTLRPYPWGLLVAPAGTLSAEDARRLRAAAQSAPESDALRIDGVGAFQLTLDGYAADGLDQLADYLFQTGTLSAVPDIPFVAIPDDDERSEDTD